MKIESLPTEIAAVVDNSNGFKRYLNSLLKGRPVTPRSWLYEGQSDTEVLRKWQKILNSKLPAASQYHELIDQFETSQLKKFGPQGEIKPIKELMDIVTAGFKGHISSSDVFKTKEWQEAKRKASAFLCEATGFESLQPRELKHVVDDMRDRDTLDSNSGYPDFGRRKKPEILQAAYAAIDSKAYLGFPAIALFRNYNQKTRLVWMYPLATNIVEGSYTQPLKDAIMKSNLHFFAPWRGYEHVLQRLSSYYGHDEFVSASDFSHTDEYFNKAKMYEVFDVIKHCYQRQYWDGLKESMLHVCDIPLIIGPHQWIIGEHGVSSGSNWTNDVETYMDFIAEIYFTIKGIVKEPANAIGDDICHRVDKYNPQLDKILAEEYQKMGFDVNSEKVTNERTWVKYLQRLTIKGYNSNRTYEVKGVTYKLLRGIYSTYRALNSSLNPEKFHSPKLWSKDMFAVRQFMILENCIDHPLFVEFVKFICAGHNYLVEFAKKSADEQNEALAKSRILPGLNPTYNQEKREKPLSEFESIRVAAQL